MGKGTDPNLGVDLDIDFKPWEFITGNDEDGRIRVDGLKKGWYRLIEVGKEDWYDLEKYEIKDYPSVDILIEDDGTVNCIDAVMYIPNDGVSTTSISGYIWKDFWDEKAHVRDNVYSTNPDVGMNNIKVTLRDSQRNIVENKDGMRCETKSAELGIYSEIDGGEYIFEQVLKDKLKDYHVEFEYNGLVYQAVDIGAGGNDTVNSKAIEGANGSYRTDLDNKFANGIVNNGELSVKVNGRSDITVGYNKTDNPWMKEIDKNSISGCDIIARTLVPGEDKYNSFGIENLYEKHEPNAVKYVNLGLYEKPQADLQLGKDLVNVDVQVAGTGGIYEYEKRNFEKTSNHWDVGVKFKDKMTEIYTQPIFQPDVSYSSDNQEKELQVYLIYKIAINNNSSYLTRADSIVDYFDSRYSFVCAGTGLDGNNITGRVNATEQSYNSEYKKVIIDSNLVVETGKIDYIYVQFKLERDAILAMMSSDDNVELLYNRAEINSYTVLKDNQGHAVAVVDENSVPGNMKPNDISTFENDTDSAPALKIELKNREIHGSVFEDNAVTSGQGNIRQGDGIYNDDENGIAGVKVELVTSDDKDVVAITTTDNDGNFTLLDFVPGEYKIVYTWGDNKYRVQNYKGTIYDINRNQEDLYWYKDQVDIRKTDAIDSYELRKSIDGQTAEITDRSIYEKIDNAYTDNYNGDIINCMNSSTPNMKIDVDCGLVSNIDFGIIERAKQEIDVEKKINTFKITLENAPLVNTYIDENGQLQGSHNSTTYMRPTIVNGIKIKGYVKTEMDNELIQGAKLEVEYKMIYTNMSEKDYMTESYYKYGSYAGQSAMNENDLVTLTPYTVIDYLDNNLGFEPEKNGDKWKQIEKDDVTKYTIPETTLLDSRKLLEAKEQLNALAPGQTDTVNLLASKLLTISDKSTFNNKIDTAEIIKPKEYMSKEHIGRVVEEFPNAEAPEVLVTPSTGDNKAYVIYITVGITSLLILGVGTFIIKKVVIDR